MSEDKEELKLDMASGGTEHSKEDDNLIKAFHDLHLAPHVETTSDLMDFLSKFGKLVSDKEVPQKTQPSASYHFPKLSTFYGEDNKGETTWETFKYEIQSLITDKVFSNEQIVLGVRRAVKRNAGDILRRLGPGISLNEILSKFDCTFGSIETKESILRQFYACQQGLKETIASYSNRLEDIYS